MGNFATKGNIWGERFYNRSATPAWHELGWNKVEEWSAVVAVEKVGIYQIDKQPLMLPSDGGFEESGFYLVRRAPTADDPVWRTFGNPVTAAYEHNDPKMTAETWDENVCGLDGKPVAIETIGVLGNGERLFISTKLPSFNVKGDQVDNYLIYDSPFIPGTAYSVNVANIRPVCQNTLQSALAGARVQHTIAHTNGARKYLADWLKTIYATSLATVDLMAKSYTELANMPVTLPQVTWIVNGTYPLPKEPQVEDRSRRDIIERLEVYENNVDLVKRIRLATIHCYEGAGQGADTAAARGTAWGAWQAVAEMETYRRGSPEKTAEQLLGGERATRMRNAFTLAQRVSDWDKIDARSLGLSRVRA